MICVYIDNKRFLKEAKYILGFFFTTLGINKFQVVSKPQDSNSILIYYGSEEITVPKGTFLIHIAETDYYAKVGNAILSSAKKCTRTPDDLPERVDFLFADESSGLENVWYQGVRNKSNLVSASDKAIHCSIDIIASSFYMLNLENERQTSERDDLGRFQKRYSTFGDPIYENPLVDQFLLLFATFIKKAKRPANNNESGSVWPQNRTFALALSHDVDRFRTWTYSKIRRTLLEKLRKNDYKESLKRLSALIHSISLKENWSGNFKYITELENKYYGNSTFFFASQRRVAQDPHYHLNCKRFRRGISWVKERNWHIGLHGTIPSAENSDFLYEEKNLLENGIDRSIIGLRQHYLRFNLHKTFDAISHAGFSYDSTLGFSNDLGYRCGTSLPFQPFNPKKKEPYPFMEIPLILMDTVLMLETNLYLGSDEAWTIVERYLEFTFKSGFCLTINWHNNNINRADVFGYGQLYEKVLNWAYERNGWICSLDDLYEWWIDKIDYSNSGK